MEILPINWETLAEEINPSEALLGIKNNKKGLVKDAIKVMNLLDEVNDLLDMPGISHNCGRFTTFCCCYLFWH